eukprot:6191088-Prymnesium_polylepis.1
MTPAVRPARSDPTGSAKCSVSGRDATRARDARARPADHCPASTTVRAARDACHTQTTCPARA